jgi:hypothetical protein
MQLYEPTTGAAVPPQTYHKERPMLSYSTFNGIDVVPGQNSYTGEAISMEHGAEYIRQKLAEAGINPLIDYTDTYWEADTTEDPHTVVLFEQPPKLLAPKTIVRARGVLKDAYAYWPPAAVNQHKITTVQTSRYYIIDLARRRVLYMGYVYDEATKHATTKVVWVEESNIIEHL